MRRKAQSRQNENEANTFLRCTLSAPSVWTGRIFRCHVWGITWDEDAEKLKHKEMAVETLISWRFSVNPATGSRYNPASFVTLKVVASSVLVQRQPEHDAAREENESIDSDESRGEKIFWDDMTSKFAYISLPRPAF